MQEAARLAHALSLVEVMDVADMHEREEQWWKLYVHNTVDATLLGPKLERERHAHWQKALASQWELFEKAEALRLKLELIEEDT